MNWLIFLAGFIAFPVLLIVLLVLFIRITRRGTVTVKSPLEMQDVLRAFLNGHRNVGPIYVGNSSQEIMVRVHRTSRKKTANTLWIDVRASDLGQAIFHAVKTAFAKESVEFEERLTPRLKRPSRLHVKFEQSGPLAISAVSHVLAIICSAIEVDISEGLKVSGLDPRSFSSKAEK